MDYKKVLKLHYTDLDGEALTITILSLFERCNFCHTALFSTPLTLSAIYNHRHICRCSEWTSINYNHNKRKFKKLSLKFAISSLPVSLLYEREGKLMIPRLLSLL